MNLGTLIIGTEILTGKRRDGHLAYVIEALARRGLTLAWSGFVGDDGPRITQSLRRSMADGDLVFVFGGIGATPDDLTRRCAADAAGVELVRHPGALAEIEARFGTLAYPNRVLMADLPAGSSLIPNPVNRICGFSLAHHHFLPGFPQMAWPMLEWVLDTQYPQLRGEPLVEALLLARGAHESELLDVMSSLVAAFPEVGFSSLPHFAQQGAEIEFGLRGRPAAVAGARGWLVQALTERGVAVHEREPGTAPDPDSSSE